MSRKHKISEFVSIRNFEVRSSNGLVFSNDENNDLPAFLKSFYQHLGLKYPKFFKMDTLSKLAFISAEFLLKNFDIPEKYSKDKVSLILANSSSSLGTDTEYQGTISDEENYFPSPALFVYTLPNIMIGEICIRNKFTGENLSLINETFCPSQLVFFTESLLDSGKADCVICGWVELSVDQKHHDAFLALIENDNTEIENNFIKFETCIFNKLYNNPEL